MKRASRGQNPILKDAGHVESPPANSQSQHISKPRVDNATDESSTKVENKENERSPKRIRTSVHANEELYDLDESFGNTTNHSPPQSANPTSQSPNRTYAVNGGYNALKSFGGQVYSGMAVGGSHTWNYDPGVWRETKEEPDLWRIDYKTTKRRAKNAPRGSGAPVGTEYHWLIVAHQYVKKIDANTYETHLAGSKYKLTHKNATSNSWAIPTVKAQRDREIELLDDAKQRVQGLPPVLQSEKVKVEKSEKGQQKLDSLFAKGAVQKAEDGASPGIKRKRSFTQ